ncbi:GTPase IMAP family member 7-like [Ostrea edulis]|uniref:GTPase IMAP family member 7-like n=1 Tax=Ostrea edulis TaxID=37623 RepID=UPI0024AF7888|nr:GTPase IMAP family member 7-like [Ostrea edulis]
MGNQIVTDELLEWESSPSQSEWKCLYCDTVHQRSVRSCEKCGRKSCCCETDSSDEDTISIDSIVTHINTQLLKHLQEIRMIVVGKMGVGKSAFCNTLAGEELFVPERAFHSITKAAHMEITERFDRDLLLIDTPCFGNKERRKEIVEFIEGVGELFLRVAPGFHCIAFVLSFESRVTRDDIQLLEDVKRVLGKEVMGHMILVFTRCPNQIALEEKLKTATGPIKKILEEVEYRVFGVENETGDRDQFAFNFCQMVDELCMTRKKVYSTDMLLKAWSIVKDEVKSSSDRMKIQNVQQKLEFMGFV